MKTLTLLRSYLEDRTIGILLENSNIKLTNTMELPWNNNKVNISCIPEGTYYIKKCPKSKFKFAWSIPHVANRTYIRIHAGNSLKDTTGCILVGNYNNNDISWLNKSMNTLEYLWDILHSENILTIKTKTI